MNPGLEAITGLLADTAPHNTGPDFGKASPIGLVIVVVLLIGTVLLVRSMNRHLRKLPESFGSNNAQPDQENTQPDQAADPDQSAAGTVDADTDGHTGSDRTENKGQSGESSG